MTIVTTHANVAQVRNTQALGGRREVERFCQILFCSSFLPLFLPHCWSWVFRSWSFASDIFLFRLRLNYNGFVFPACRRDFVKVWPFQILNILPTLLQLYPWRDKPNCSPLEGRIGPKMHCFMQFFFSTKLMPESVFVDHPLTKEKCDDFFWATEKLVPGFLQYSSSN